MQLRVSAPTASLHYLVAFRENPIDRFQVQAERKKQAVAFVLTNVLPLTEDVGITVGALGNVTAGDAGSS